MTTVIDGNRLAEQAKQHITREVGQAHAAGLQPGLATVLVGDDYAAAAYERRLRRLAEAVGCRFVSERLGAAVELADALATVGKLNADPRISGILILRPLPPSVPEVELYRILEPAKDIEAVTPTNSGLLAQGIARFVPSTPASCFYLLDAYARSSGGDPATALNGKTVVLVGRSNNVGKPAVWLALERGATVISCDKATADAGRLRDFTAQADVLVVAAGVPNLITGDDVRNGVVVIDVGINPVVDPSNGRTRLVGDVEFVSVAPKAAAITPVPGGVGPMTDVWLVHNAVSAATSLRTSGLAPWIAV
jgi:methylenetetrahydrofolate dehydrogenase (NADP+)/methenyltetrahydrofolate cyclohydrolase